MSINDWIYDFRRQARANNDQQRLKLSQLYDQAMRIHDQQPQEALKLLEDGRQLAESLGESWWIYFFDHWRLYVMDDSRKEIEIAATAIAEIRKPEYDGFPQRACLHEDLITAYLALDARSYAEDIQQALAYMERELSPQVDCYFCCLSLKSDFAGEQQAWADMHDIADELHQALDRSSLSQLHHDHYKALMSKRMAAAAWQQKDWESLARYAASGVEWSKPYSHLKKQHAALLAWQAVVAQHAGDTNAAQAWYRQSYQIYQQFEGEIGEAWFLAATAYFELQADWEQVLALWIEDVTHQSSLSNFSHLFRSLVAQRRALLQLGRDTSENDAALHKVLSEFRHPEKYQTELQQLGFV